MKKDNPLTRRRKSILDAWKTLAPGVSLNGMTLEQFEEATQKSLDVRQRMAETERAMIALRQERLQEDRKLREKISELVDSVKGHTDYGANSPLYSAFGYVPKNARKSGLTRRNAKRSTSNPTTSTDAV